MTNQSASPSSGSKRALIIAGSLIAALAVVYFSFFYPPVSTSDTEGTIGAVKKYRTEQITEKDIVLDAMASTNIEMVGKAVQQTGAKLSESAREAGKAAEEALASARAPEAREFLEHVTALSKAVLALQAGDASAAYIEQVAAIAEKAKEARAQVDGMTADARTEMGKLQEQAALLEKYSTGLREMTLRMEYMKLNNAAQLLAVQAEEMQIAGKEALAGREALAGKEALASKAADWQSLADAAAALAKQAEGLKEYSRKEEVSRLAESATAFARAAHERFTASGRQASEAAQAAVEASKAMAGRAADLARPQGEQRTGQPE